MIEQYKVYLPMITNSMSRLDKAGVISESSDDVSQMYYNRVRPYKVFVHWMDIETAPSQYDWSTADNKLAGLDLEYLWITVVTTPTFFLPSPNDPVCELFDYPARMEWFYNFMVAVDQRYSPDVLCYMNEPDSPSSEHPRNFGCLGPNRGDDYGRVMKNLYSRWNGNAKIAVGEVSNVYGQFVTDMLARLDGNFDYLAFHCYAGFYNDVGIEGANGGGTHLFNDCDNVHAYAQTLSNKEAILSETAVHYHALPVTPEKEQAYYDSQVEYYTCCLQYLDAITFWYTGWKNGWPEPPRLSTDMVDNSGFKRPVFYKYNFDG